MTEKPDTPDQIEPSKDQTAPKPAGPHARDELTDYEKTPGTGSLPGGPGQESDIGPD